MRFASVALSLLLAAAPVSAQTQHVFGDFWTENAVSVEVRFAQPVLVLVALGGRIYFEFGAPPGYTGPRVRLQLLESATLVNTPAQQGCALYVVGPGDVGTRLANVDQAGFNLALAPNTGYRYYGSLSVWHSSPYLCMSLPGPAEGCLPRDPNGVYGCQADLLGAALVFAVELY
ncbi:MAG: hypothetical protein IPM29_20430 [Planctomycetes bacterium]|nr:hypothetical protein [Planctomycetota bacterium]